MQRLPRFAFQPHMTPDVRHKKMTEMMTVLRNGIDRLYEDGAREIEAGTLLIFGKDDLDGISYWLSRWADRGWIEILKPIQEASAREIVIKLNSFLYPSDEPPYHWPNYASDPDNPEYKINLTKR